MKRANSGGINPGELVDRISSLPDSILSLILSFLPTKNAVFTSLLSKRWEFLWRTVINLDFCHNEDFRKSEEPEHEADMKFVCFVNSVLLLHDVGFLNKFSLVWKPRCIPSQINTWISTVITRNVSEIVLCVEKSDRPFQVSRSVFNCGTLQSLELSGYMFVSAAIPVCLPRLESLKLDSVCFQSEEAFEKLISGCPMLKYLLVRISINKMTEYLQTYHRMEINVFKYVVSSTSLRCLEHYMESESVEDDEWPHYNLELEASSLKYLKLVGCISGIHVQESLSSLVEADFGIRERDYESCDFTVSNSLIEAVCDCLWVLSFASISPRIKSNFTSLTKLEAGADYYCSSLVEDIIQSAQSLEVLTLGQLIRCLDVHSNTEYEWSDPLEIPRCLSNNLKAVEFTCYSGFDIEREMVGYLLKHGSVLEVMKISCDSYRKDVKYELLQEICKLPRKSPTCKIKYSG